MPYREEDFASMPIGQFGVEGYLTYLNELDPTHVTKHSTRFNASNASQMSLAWRAPSSSSLLAYTEAAPVLLELDPTHFHIR